MNLAPLILIKHKEGCLKSFFTKKGYKIKELVNSSDLIVIAIDYIEKAVKNFESMWAKEARGRVYAIFNDQIYTLKTNLIKGFELPDLAFTEEHFSENHLKIVQKFNEGGVLEDSYLSEKIDGCLITVSVHQKNTVEYNLMVKLIKNAWYVETEELLFVPASRSTLFLGEDMKKYFLQSFSGYVGKNVERGWSQYKNIFLELVLKVYSTCVSVKTDAVSLIFEAVCKNRGFKTELTVSYDFDRLFYLGYCDETSFTPHYKTDQSLVQPNWYRVQSIKEVKEVLVNLNTNLQYDGKVYGEGFVYFDHFRCNFYYKLKPALYYKCHKPKPEYVKELLDLNNSYDQVYPLVKDLKFIYSERLIEALKSYKIHVDEYIKPLLNDSIKGNSLLCLFAVRKDLNFSFFTNHFPIVATDREVFNFSRATAIADDLEPLKQFFIRKLPRSVYS